MKKNILSILLITVGLVLILSSLGLKIYSKNKDKQLIKEFNNEMKLQKDQKQEENEQHKQIKYTNDEGDRIAIMEIPSINLKSVIVEGTNMNDLRFYLGHFNNTAMPGTKGNFSIAGHSSTIYNEILNNLHKVNIEDEIKIKTLTGEYEYVITKKFVVEPTEISVLDQDMDRESMTIVTCTEKGKRRFIVKAEMKK